MRQPKIHQSYEAGPRTTLRPGDKFRASGGPYWEGPSGDKLSLAERGPFTFIRYVEQGASKYIEAFDRSGNHCVLNVGKRRRWSELTSVVNAPYKVRGRVKAKAQA